MRGGVESDPYPLMLFVVVVYSFSHSPFRSLKEKKTRNTFFQLGIPPHKIRLLSFAVCSSPLLPSTLRSSLTHTHLSFKKILHPFSLTQTSKREHDFHSLPLSFSHTTCVDCWSCVGVSSFDVCVRVFVLAQRRNALLINQEEAEKYSHIFRTGKILFRKMGRKNRHFFLSID